ncbi:MAG: anti-sigma factor domain-containing protein [Actinomycetota bacterium]
MSHAEIQQLLGAYALDAVEVDEKARIEQHLVQCGACRAEVDDHRRALAELSESTMPAPVGLWEKIEAALEEAPPPLNLAPVVSMPARRSVSLRLAGAVAAVAAALVAILGIRVLQQDSRITALESSNGDDRLSLAAIAASADPGADKITLRSADESLAVNAVLLPDGTGYLVSDNLPRLPTDRTYQLWALADGSRISIGVLGAGPGIVAFRAPARADGLAITEEPAGGVGNSQKTPVVVGLRKA